MGGADRDDQGGGYGNGCCLDERRGKALDEVGLDLIQYWKLVLWSSRGTLYPCRVQHRYQVTSASTRILSVG